ncbi:hypothetical protein [Vibrio algicola]|uniref:Uncharacterized protein n=1 Tax=Vibrio algicola TaxID=2662262 RepID=A0A5Q0TCX8_9VIBR|nr:hypothetical protein [Vibrio algicola]
MEQIHMPCPDLVAYSLTAEQKKHGLEKLREVRKTLGEKMLADLRSEYPNASRLNKAKLKAKSDRIKRDWF